MNHTGGVPGKSVLNRHDHAPVHVSEGHPDQRDRRSAPPSGHAVRHAPGHRRHRPLGRSTLAARPAGARGSPVRLGPRLRWPRHARRLLARRSDHGLLVGDRAGDRRAPGGARLHRLRDGAAGRVDRRPRGARLPRARPRRHRRRVAPGRGGGRLRALVNNAGYSQSGAIEDVPLDDVRRQFETNVFGLVRMCQLVLPGMRTQGYGRIVNLSSVGGKVWFPGGGIYHGTKHAVEGISDALRWEVHDFGVDVVIIEPGLIKTKFADAAIGSIDDATQKDGTYAEFNKQVAEATAGAYEGPMSRLAAGPEAVA